MNTHPLDQPASVSRLHEWRQSGHINDCVLHALLEKLRSVRVWRSWAAACFLIIGVVLLLCGTVFFFAWNWEGMARWQRLALAAAGVVLPALGSRFVDDGSMGRKMCLLTSSMMIGVFLAVFGQEYQTGADTHGLFFGWAALSLLWVLCAEFEALWILWTVILSTGVVFYWKDVLVHPPAHWPWPYVPLALSGIHLLALAAKETLAARGWEWLQARWSRLWLVFWTLAFPAALACVLVVDFHVDERSAVSVGALAWMALAGILFAVYRYRIKDSAAMSLTVLSVAIVVTTAAARWLWEVMDAIGNSPLIVGGFLFNTGAIGALIAGWVWLIRKLTMQMASEEAPSAEPEKVDGKATGPLTWREALGDIAPDERVRMEEQLTSLASKPHEPLWLKAISGIGGWVAAWAMLPMLFFVLSVFWRDDSGAAIMVSGFVFLGVSVWLSRIMAKTVFLQQMNLALAIGCFALINTGYLMDAREVSWGAFAFMQCVIAAVTYWLFQNGPYRFLVSVWSIASIVGWISIDRHGQAFSIPVFVVILSAITTWLWTWRTRPEVLNSLAYATAFSLAGTVFFFTMVRDMRWMHLAGAPTLGAAALAVGLVTLVTALNRGVRSLTSPWIIGLIIIVLPLAWAGEMGVLTAMLLTAAAFAWGDKMLGVFAWIFLAGFLFFFYYEMSVPLSMKAAIIGGSGLIFLIIRTVLLRLDQSNSPA